jgi:nucleotide-binding universal stress UspA family protein
MAELELKRILCPVDFSTHSTQALRLAGRLAEVFSAELVVLHAQQFEFPIYFTAAQTEELKAQLRKEERAARSYLDEYVNQHLVSSVKRSALLKEGEPVTEILTALKDYQAGLVVMGTHGRTGLTRARLGSVMESVMRVADVPVLSVGPHVSASPAGARFRRVLCSTDLSSRDQQICDWAAKLAEMTGAELTVLHVVEKTSSEDSPDEAIRQKLCEWVSPSVRNRCSVREIIRRGNASEQIVQEAKNAGAELLVLGAYPRSGIETVLFGSTTETLVRIAPCPVLTINHSQASIASSKSDGEKISM